MPHTIAADAKGNIYVGDRSNRRIQVFDPDGKFQREITIDIPVPPGVQPWMSPMPSAEAAARQSWRPVGDLHHAWSHTISIQCRWVSRPDLQAFPGWQVLGVLGTTARELKEFGWIHELACLAENTLHAAELLNWRVQKLTLHPDRPASASGADR